MNPPRPNWERCESVEDVTIPSPDGKTIAKTIKVTVPAWRDPDDGEIYLDGEAVRIIDDARARYLGLLTTDGLRSLRTTLNLTQKRLSELLQLGDKTWTRWESGRERPSKSLNVLICALRDRRIDIPYLERLATGQEPIQERQPVSFGQNVGQQIPMEGLLQGWIHNVTDTTWSYDRSAKAEIKPPTISNMGGFLKAQASLGISGASEAPSNEQSVPDNIINLYKVA